MIPDTPSDADEKSDQDAVFVQQYLLTGDPITACIRAGIRDPRYPITVMADRQMKKPEIAAAIKALAKIDAAGAPMEVTRESIVADMEDVYGKALTDGQYASAIGAKRMQAMLLGYMDQKLTINHSFKVEHMSDEQLLRIAAGNARDVTKDIIEVEDE